MNDNRINKVKDEMKRLKAAIKEFEANGHQPCSKQSAAVKRASMDLTRALAELRQPYVYILD